MFTDLVGSTRLLGELGDVPAEDLRRQHFALLHEATSRRGGRVVKTLGDGVMAVFESASNAVAAAVAIQRGTQIQSEDESHTLQVRIGLHVGEPQRDADDYFGTPVVIARRLCDLAAGGQILTSALVPALVGGQCGFGFLARKPQELKGVPGPVDVCEVDWHESFEADEPRSARRAVRILIADDHPTFRSGLTTLLAAVEGVEVVGEAATGREAVDAALALEPDVVVMDLQMPELNGIEATRELLKARPGMGVLVLTMFEDDDSVFAAMRAGARGYVLKGAKQEKIVQAIEVIASGEAIFGPGIAQRVLSMFAATDRAPEPFPDLTDREREVLDLIAAGTTNADIARRLVVSPKTVRNHVSNIFNKLQVVDRGQAIVRAREAGLGQSSEPRF